jgi:hypothetical protein
MAVGAVGFEAPHSSSADGRLLAAVQLLRV